MTITLKAKKDLENVLIDLPIKRFSILSHLDNINYCIEQLRNRAGDKTDYVVGYVLQRGWGTREAYHRILSKEEANNLKKQNSRFNYFTLDNILKRKAEIESGKYAINDGLIMGFNSSY